ncbi:restriction endonuclease subunit S [Bacillus sp. JJ634]
MVVKVKEVREGYKMTELGEIPIEWEIKTISDLTKVKTGGTPSKSKPEYWVNGKIPWMSSGEINYKRIHKVKEKITELGFQNSNTTLLPTNTIMMAMNGQGKTRGTVAMLHIDTTCNQSLAGILPSDKYNSEYLFYYLESQYEALRSITGEGRSGLNLSLIRSFPVIFPSLKEQQKIAEILSTVDHQIDNTNQLIAETKELKKGLMQQLLTKGIGHTEFKQTELGEIPVSWKIYQQGEIATFYNGRAYKQAEFKNEGTPIVRIQNLTGEREPVYSDLLLEENKYIDNGDLIYAWSATFGPYIWRGAKSIYHYHIWKVEVKEGCLDKLFFYYRLDHISNEMNSQKNGSAFAHLTKGSMESYKISLPPLKEQQKIAEILSTVDNQIESYEQEKEKYTELKKGLMQQLLTGKIRVTV